MRRVSTLVPAEFRALLRGPLGWFYVVTLITSVGIGLTLVFSVVYVHDVRHFSVALATGLLAVNAAALGETLWSPVGPALVNDLAPEHLRGRYNAAFGLTWGLSGAFAPLVAGLFLGSHLAERWPYAVAVGALVGGALIYRLRPRLTPAEDGRVAAAS